MPTIIDSLVIALGLDDSGYNRSSRNAEQNFKRLRESGTGASKQIGGSLNQLSGALGKVRNEVVGLALAFTSVSFLKSFAQNIINTDANLGQLSQRLGIATTELSAFRNAAKEAGGNEEAAKGLEQTFAIFAKAKQDLALGGSVDNGGILNQIFGGPIDPHIFDTPQGALLSIIGALQKFNPERRAYFAEALGIPDSVLPLLNQSRENVEALIQRQRELGGTTQEDAQAALEFNRELTAVGTQITNLVRPAVEQLVTLFSRLVSILETVARTAALPFVLIGQAVDAATNKGATLQSVISRVGSAGNILVRDIARSAGRVITGVTGADRPGGGPVGQGGAGPGGNAALSGRDSPAIAQAKARAGSNADIISFFKQRGYSDNAALGLYAAIIAESQGNERAVNPTSGAAGLGQLLGPRRKTFAQRYGVDASRATRQQQLDFIDYELRTSEANAGSGIRAANSPQSALQTAVTQFYRPGPGTIADLRNGGQALARVGAGTSSVTIGSIVVNTRATNADQIAAELPAAISRRGIVNQAARGLD